MLTACHLQTPVRKLLHKCGLDTENYMKCIVVEEHKSNYPNPIRFKKGERLVIGKKDTDFEGDCARAFL